MSNTILFFFLFLSFRLVPILANVKLVLKVLIAKSISMNVNVTILVVPMALA